MAQVIADQLGVPYEDVTVFEGDSSRGGFAPGAAGSRQGVIGGGASMKAAQLLKDKVKRVAIDPSLLGEDRDMLEDLVAAAINDAVRRAEVTTQEKMAGLTMGMPMPPGFKLPF